MDEITFKQLKNSKYYHPVVTDVILDHEMMLEMVEHSIGITEKGYDTVIDSVMFNFLVKYFKHGIELIEKRIEKAGIKMRMICEVNKENIDIINSIKFHDIKHIDGIRGNFGIFDKRAYMVFIFHRESDQPDQTLWSNSKLLVDKQQTIFNKMWEIAMPLSARNKELEYQQFPEYQKKITNSDEIQKEINNLLEQCRHDLLIISSIKMLNLLLLTPVLLSQLAILLKRGINIRVLLNGKDTDITNQFKFINGLGLGSKIEYKISNQLDKFNESILISDGKSMLRLNLTPAEEPFAYFSTEAAAILIQEILFEKYWNELLSLEAVNNL